LTVQAVLASLDEDDFAYESNRWETEKKLKALYGWLAEHPFVPPSIQLLSSDLSSMVLDEDDDAA
jgi:hypothetical protein